VAGRPRKQLLTIDDLCHFLNCKSKMTVYNMVDKGMPYHRVGVGYQAGMRFDQAEVMRWIDQQEKRRERSG
jgi:excisionase family DNA binding protein